MTEPTSLIDPSKRIGTVTRVLATAIELTLPDAMAAAGRRGLARGAVGDFVFIDCDRETALGRITEVGIPERQRPGIDQQIEKDPVVEPQGRVQLLATVDKTTRKVARGINTYPRVGDGVYLAEGSSLAASIKNALRGDVHPVDELLLVHLGKVSGLDNAEISIPPEKLFGRHCGVFGATGGGKSWTVSRLVNEVVRIGGKCILFDPTGEFSGKVVGARQYSFGEALPNQPLVRFPSTLLSEMDLHALLTPQGQSQGPALRGATKSLRMAKVLQGDMSRFVKRTVGGNTHVTIQEANQPVGDVIIEESGSILKANQSRVAFGKAEIILARELSAEHCDIDFRALSKQVRNECVQSMGRDNHVLFGSGDMQLVGYCNTLIIRIETYLSSPELACLFSDIGEDITNLIDSFLHDATARAMVISFEKVSFKHNTREILLNTLGRYLLGLARRGSFKENPLVCFLDEAHQFIGRTVGDEQNSIALDAFGLIAKEGRKYGLTTVIATQRPRDVPQDVLSQLGTLFVHRLTNDRDRETIERACGDLDRSAAAFIPSLGQGEAIVVGPELPAPLPIVMTMPEKGQQPESHGPQYQRFWGQSSGDAVS